MLKKAFVFPGQGSQTVGMGKGLAEPFLDRANEVLGFDLKKICLEGPAEELKKTEITQPAIFTVSVAAFHQLTTHNLQLTTDLHAVAGHSLGEYSALYAAGALSFEDGVKILNLRGKFMQEAVPIGAGAMMAVLGLAGDKIAECCKNAEGAVSPANFNSPGQVVISGEANAVSKAAELCKQAGAKRVIPLVVSAPFHCALMKPAQEKLAKEIEKITIKDAKIPVVANVTADYVTSASDIKDLLIKQVTAPVRWEDSVKKMIADGVAEFVEIGPGKVLSGLIKKIDRSVLVGGYNEIKR